MVFPIYQLPFTAKLFRRDALFFPSFAMRYLFTYLHGFSLSFFLEKEDGLQSILQNAATAKQNDRPGQLMARFILPSAPPKP